MAARTKYSQNLPEISSKDSGRPPGIFAGPIKYSFAIKNNNESIKQANVILIFLFIIHLALLPNGFSVQLFDFIRNSRFNKSGIISRHHLQIGSIL